MPIQIVRNDITKMECDACVSRSENRSCTGFEPHHCRSQNRTAAAPLTALVPVQNRRQRTVH